MESVAQDTSTSRRKVARLAWSVLGYNLAVILWGAFVRATGSGAGCGRHWPLCNGEVVPRPQSLATIIEAGHRATSGIAVVAVIALLVATRVALPRGHRARRSAAWATVFIFGEALIGAGLVLFELVAHDASSKRALSMILHLNNTFLLLGALTLTAWWTHRKDPGPARAGEGKPPIGQLSVIAASLGSVALLGASGAVAALGDTLFPAASLREGLVQDLSPVAHLFLRLRLLHPVIALAAGVLVLCAAGVVRSFSASPEARRFARMVTLLLVAQFAAGILNVTLLAPVGMQLVHLMLADLTWIALVLMGSEAWAAPVPAPSSLRPGAEAEPAQ